MNDVMCKGDSRLGTACGKCSRCVAAEALRPENQRLYPVGTERNWQADFDAQRLRADTAEAEIEVLKREVECRISNEVNAFEALAAAEQRIAAIQKQLDSIDNHLRGNVNDPEPLPPIMPGAVSYTTTYGLVAGLRRERDYLKKTATPLPAGDDYLRQLAQRLREYVGNPHHIDPLSESFKRLIDDSAYALSKLAALNPNPEAESHE